MVTGCPKHLAVAGWRIRKMCIRADVCRDSWSGCLCLCVVRTCIPGSGFLPDARAVECKVLIVVLIVVVIFYGKMQSDSHKNGTNKM